MNTGIISSRYAKALLLYCESTGGGEKVAAQVRSILANPEQLKSEKLQPELQRFVSLLIENGRVADVRLYLHSFLEMYHASRGIKLVHLSTCVAAPGLEDRLRVLLEKEFGCKVIFETEVDPSLIGGFTIQVGDRMLDASVRRQLEKIRREFVIENNRLV